MVSPGFRSHYTHTGSQGTAGGRMTSEEKEAREQLTTYIRDVPSDENRRATWSNLDYE